MSTSARLDEYEPPIPEFVPASMDPETGVQSKDVIISPEEKVASRIYLPRSAAPGRKLPLLVYYHGGGFMIESAFSPLYHKHLNHLVAEAKVVAVSVEYKLAPKHPLPIAYDDSWLALEWVVSQSKTGDLNSEPWIRDFADLDRVYLGGDSAGANIAHRMAILFGSEKKLDGIHLRGIFLNCPFFWGKDLIGKEIEYCAQESHIPYYRLWSFACPSSSGLDDPRINPGLDPELSRLGGSRVLVHVGGEDILRERGLYYKEVLEKSGWTGVAEVVDVEGEDHVWSVHNPTSDNGMAMLKKVSEFLNYNVHC